MAENEESTEFYLLVKPKADPTANGTIVRFSSDSGLEIFAGDLRLADLGLKVSEGGTDIELGNKGEYEMMPIGKNEALASRQAYLIWARAREAAIA